MTATRLRRLYGAMGIMIIVALLPYVCRGTMFMLATAAVAPHYASPDSSHVALSSAALATAPQAGAHCTEYDCCSNPSKQQNRFRAELPAIAIQAAASPTAPVASLSALVHATGARPNAAPPGIQTPLIL